MNYQHLTTELERLEENRLRIRNEGEVLSSHWVDSTKARGKIYHRLRRWNEGGAEFVRILKLEELAGLRQCAISLGNWKRLTSPFKI